MKILISIAMLLPAIVFADINIPDTAPPLPPNAEYPPGVAEDVAAVALNLSQPLISAADSCRGRCSLTLSRIAVPDRCRCHLPPTAVTGVRR